MSMVYVLVLYRYDGMLAIKVTLMAEITLLSIIVGENRFFAGHYRCLSYTCFHG